MSAPLWYSAPSSVGATARAVFQGLFASVAYVGGVTRLMGRVIHRLTRSFVPRAPRVRVAALAAQCFRFGVVSIPIIILVQVFIGVILALNLAPTLASYGQIERIADVVAIAVLRELGPLITAVLLSGFAGASIAAELGAMVEGEEIKALRAHALDPIRFLIAPRVVATAIMTLGLTVLADACGILGGLITAVFVLDISPDTYLIFTRESVTLKDYFTGLFKGFVFGGMIAAIASYEGLNVRGGSAGVGHATTVTVVKSIVALIAADCVFAGVFYVLEW